MTALVTTLMSGLFAYLLNSLWQVPLVFIAAWIAARLTRPLGPRIEHRVWVGALMLQAILPLCHFRINGLLQQAWGLLLSFFGSAAGGETRVIVGASSAASAAMLRLPPWLMTALVLAYACSLLYFAGRLTWSLWRTTEMRRTATTAMLTDAHARKLDRCRQFFRIADHAVQVAIAPSLAGPVTIGIRHWTLLLPPAFLDKIEAGDLHAVFAHECAHLRRRDFAKNLLYGLVALPVAWHPLLWLTRLRLAETRELVCDAIAAAAVAGRESYASSLLRLASMLSTRMAAENLHAIGIFDANVFERRIMNLTRKHFEIRGLRRLATAALCGAIAVTTCTSAMAFRMDVDDTAAAAQKAPPKQIHVNADNLKIVNKVPPVYPVEAKEHKIQGSVVLSVVINKDGSPENIKVQGGPNELQQSAVDAVRQWRWQPFLLNGDPIEVLTTITVVYSLAG
jgi:TonB family protein